MHAKRCAVLAAGHSGHLTARAVARSHLSLFLVPTVTPLKEFLSHARVQTGKETPERSVPHGRGTTGLCSQPVPPQGPASALCGRLEHDVDLARARQSMYKHRHTVRLARARQVSGEAASVLPQMTCPQE